MGITTSIESLIQLRLLSNVQFIYELELARMELRALEAPGWQCCGAEVQTAP